MSVSSITNAAIARRTDFPPLGTVPKGLGQIAQVIAGPPLGGTPSPSTSATNALQVIAAFIPTEVLTLYVACISALHQANQVTPAEWIAFWCFLAATPVIVWIVYASKVKAAEKPIPIALKKWPLWEMSAATIAFTAWAYALPGTPFSEFGLYSPALAGFIVLVVSTFLGLLAPLFQQPLSP